MKNVENDEKHYHELRNQDWNVLIIWECEIEKDFEATIKYIEESLFDIMMQTP